MELTGKWCLSAVFHHHGCLKFATQLTRSTLTDTQKAQSPFQCQMMTNSVTLLIFEIIFFLIIKNGSQIHDGNDVLNGQKWRERYAIQSWFLWNAEHDGDDGKSLKRSGTKKIDGGLLEDARQHARERSGSIQKVYWGVEERNGRVHKIRGKGKRQEKYDCQHCILQF